MKILESSVTGLSPGLLNSGPRPAPRPRPLGFDISEGWTRSFFGDGDWWLRFLRDSLGLAEQATVGEQQLFDLSGFGDDPGTPVNVMHLSTLTFLGDSQL